MRFLTNIGDPTRPDAGLLTIRRFYETVGQAWIADKIIGRPRATEYMTTAVIVMEGNI